MPSLPEHEEELEQSITVSAPLTPQATTAPTPIPAPRVPTSPEEWSSPRKIGFVVELPSGNLCRMKRTMDMKFLLDGGMIPNPLADIISKTISEGQPQTMISGMTPEAQTQMFEMINQGCVRSMVEPKVAIPPLKDDDGNFINPEMWQAPPGYISIMDLTMEDRLFIWSVTQGGAADLANFRETQAAAMGALQDVKGVQPKTVSPNRAQRRKATAGK